MSKKNSRMSRGFAALFDDNEVELASNDQTEDKETSASGDGSDTAGGDRIRTIRISMIEPDRDQPRKNFDEEKLSELADNITRMGVIQPILVRPAETEGRYTIVAGERRWRAARIAGLTEIPAIVRELSEEESSQVALIENLQREDLSPIEEAKAYLRLKTVFGMTQESISKVVGKSRSAVANSLRLLDLEPECIEALERGDITVGHAKALLMCSDRDGQLRLLALTLEGGLTVRELEGLASNPADIRPQTVKKTIRLTADDRALEEYRLSMKEVFGVEAKFKRNAGGRLSMKVSFGDEDELKEFLKRLMDK